MPLDSWEEAAGKWWRGGRGGRKQVPCHILSSYLEATSASGAWCWGAGRFWGGGGGRSFSLPKLTKKEGLGTGEGTTAKCL